MMVMPETGEEYSSEWKMKVFLLASCLQSARSNHTANFPDPPSEAGGELGANFLNLTSHCLHTGWQAGRVSVWSLYSDPGLGVPNAHQISGKIICKQIWLLPFLPPGPTYHLTSPSDQEKYLMRATEPAYKSSQKAPPRFYQ